ncbi:MAG TPA: hypothetical protein VEH50_11065 [Methylomirabilota bacterium]|nr:hypothetical protein [Methylomirabilota bacterium]
MIKLNRTIVTLAACFSAAVALGQGTANSKDAESLTSAQTEKSTSEGASGSATPRQSVAAPVTASVLRVLRISHPVTVPLDRTLVGSPTDEAPPEGKQWLVIRLEMRLGEDWVPLNALAVFEEGSESPILPVAVDMGGTGTFTGGTYFKSATPGASISSFLFAVPTGTKISQFRYVDGPKRPLEVAVAGPQPK